MYAVWIFWELRNFRSYDHLLLLLHPQDFWRQGTFGGEHVWYFDYIRQTFGYWAIQEVRHFQGQESAVPLLHSTVFGKRRFQSQDPAVIFTTLDIHLKSGQFRSQVKFGAWSALELRAKVFLSIFRFLSVVCFRRNSQGDWIAHFWARNWRRSHRFRTILAKFQKGAKKAIKVSVGKISRFKIFFRIPQVNRLETGFLEESFFIPVFRIFLR